MRLRVRVRVVRLVVSPHAPTKIGRVSKAVSGVRVERQPAAQSWGGRRSGGHAARRRMRRTR